MENQTRDIIKKGLEQLRNKLLDISGRNPLISFRHSDHSKGQIHAIHTPLEATYIALIEETKIFFKPLPEPILEIKFNEELGINQTVSSQITQKERAIQLGLNPSYDLELEYNESSKEAAIQTLLFPDKFLKKMTGFLDVQKQYLEETGVNCMHACFGFMEWFESPQSKTPIISPLLMVPVLIEKEYKQQQSLFRLNFTGEETRDNPALNEKMKKEFGLKLPILKSDTTPSKYFSELKTIIKDQPRWKIKQRLTIGRVSFAKILMYHDLDPNQWPDDDPIFAQPLVHDFFNGTESHLPGGFALDDHLDETDPASPVPLIISDLDSSQLSAVSDAMNNKSFVIEGPPGTGKSQTITNIIAAAISAGKSVLFVAEKLVALEVVKNRLDAAGLGQFCLELHSTKIQKGKFYEGLKSRLELRGDNDNKLSKKITTLINEHREIKHKLNLYASAMGTNFGMSDRTLHEYFWLYQQRKDVLPPELIEKIESLFLKNASHLPETELSKFKEYAEKWVSYHHEISKKFGDIKKHPFHGFHSNTFGNYEITELHQRIKRLREKLVSLQDIAKWLETNVTTHKFVKFSELVEITDQLHQLSECLKNTLKFDTKMFSNIRDQTDVDFLLNFCKQKHCILQYQQELKQFITISDFDTSTDLQGLINQLTFIWSEVVREGLQEWTPLQIKMALQSEELNELDRDFTIKEFIYTLRALQESQQKWQDCEKSCRTFLSAHQDIDDELMSHLQSLLRLSREGGFEQITPDRWEKLSKEFASILENLKDSFPLDFDDMMLDLPKHFQEENIALRNLKHYFISVDNLTDRFSVNLNMFINLVESLNNRQLTLSEIELVKLEKIAQRDAKEAYRKIHVDIIRSIVPKWSGQLSIKTLATLSHVYAFLAKSSRDVLKIRTSQTGDEKNHSNLREAINKYHSLQKKRVDLEARIQLDIDSKDLKQHISILKNCGIFSWLKKEVREVKRIFREHSIGNQSCSIKEMLFVFEQLQSYKHDYSQFIHEPRYTIFLNILQEIGASRLQELVDLIDWSEQINQYLKGNDSLFIALKNYIFNSDLPVLDSLIQKCESIDYLIRLKDHSTQNALSLIDDQIDNLNIEIDSLDQLQKIAKEVSYREEIKLEKAKEAYPLYNSLIKTREIIKTSTFKLNDRSKILQNAIDLCSQIGLKTTSEPFSIYELIKLLEHYEFLKNEVRQKEEILFSKKSLLKRFSELCNLSLLRQNIAFNDIKECITKLQLLQKAKSDLSHEERFSFISEISDANNLSEVNYACQLYLDLINKNISHSLIRYIQHEDMGSKIKELELLHSQLIKILPEALNELESIIKKGDINSKTWFGKVSVQECSLHDVINKFEEILQMREHHQEWIEFRNLEQKIEQCGIKTLCNHIVRQNISTDLIPIAIDFVYFQSIINLIQKEYSVVNQVEYHDHNNLRKRFAEIDQQLIELYRKLAVAKLIERTIDPGTRKGLRKEWTGKALLELEVAKKKKHRPIRELLINAGEAMQSLKPCFMMSPLSVVQYLAPGNLKFDLIIIDEASQVKPEDAIGTIARGKQIIVVGDPKQLPPTDFWKKGNDSEDDEDEHEDIGNEESILDLAATVYQPMRRLRWHYRSQHESLINFSNKEFYDDNLIIFPSPNFNDGKLGLSYHFVEDARYLRGGDKINPEEATQLVNAVELFMRDHPHCSIGIVTMNVAQRELINELMNARFSESTIAEEYRAKWKDTLEEFFVKNIETVQGDERDVIFISTLYGKEDSSEKLHQNFGPINKANGHRRLNVLFTRAKQKIVIFSSLNPDEIRTTDESSRGLRVFKDYLKYAKTGNLSRHRLTGRDYGSDFESSVAKYIKDWGYEVDSQVGVGGYFLDLAVVHPHKPGKHMLAIECDGVTYHSSRSARDRDRLRHQALERMGWCIHRIWSTDWFRNRRAELKHLKALLLLKAEEL